MLPFLTAGFDSLRISTPEELFPSDVSFLIQTTKLSNNNQKKKKKNKNKNKKPASILSDQPTTSPSIPNSNLASKNTNGTKKNKRSSSIVRRFDTYFGSGDLSDWQRLCWDVGLEEEYPTKTQCKKALRTVHVNIYDLLDAVKAGNQVYRFKNQWQLAQYCKETKKIYPKKKAKESGPIDFG
ncbi:hypothetical protein B0T18DRAFT_488747 [Schizothecium vesticola]|uniref:Uncharacterized protein n=1 Tax=Schizothecium vesticola TaxID=314040 RepID=A0AA40K4Z3_9PEZI|nr:hypothetical protein B0T18DRAFT_488747 [Schizothecium vesticola]